MHQFAKIDQATGLYACELGLPVKLQHLMHVNALNTHLLHNKTAGLSDSDIQSSKCCLSSATTSCNRFFLTLEIG